jgi:hypothetical protein
MVPWARFELATLRLTALSYSQFAGAGLSVENQRVALKSGESTSLLYSPFVRNSSPFAAIAVTFSLQPHPTMTV